jgi:hypothetical protein
MPLAGVAAPPLSSPPAALASDLCQTDGSKAYHHQASRNDAQNAHGLPPHLAAALWLAEKPGA